MSECESKLVSSRDLMQDFDPLTSLPSPREATLEALVDETTAEGIDLVNVDGVDFCETSAPSTSRTPVAPDGATDASPTYVPDLILLGGKATPAAAANVIAATGTTPTTLTISTVSTTPTISPSENTTPLSVTTQEVTPQKLEPTTPITAIESPLSANAPTGMVSEISTPSSRRKKKKHKRTSLSGKGNVKSQVTPNKSHMTTEQITSEMNEIDHFLQSLKVGPLHLDPSPVPMAHESSTVAETESHPPPHPSVEVMGHSMGLSLIRDLSSGSSSSEESDSEESSSESSGDNHNQPISVISEERESEDGDELAKKKSKGSLKYGYPMTKDEVHYQDIPPPESCELLFPEGGELIPMGVVSHITEELVVIQAYPGTLPVDEGTVLWSNQKKSLSVVFEIFGPVKSPYYSVRVRSADHALSLGLAPGTVVHILGGDKQLTKYVFTQQLLQQRGSDASWKDDTEVPENLQEYSDDEMEHVHNRSKRQGKRCGNTTPPTSALQPQVDTPPQPKYTSNPKMSAYFPRATVRSPWPSTYPQAPPPRERAYFPWVSSHPPRPPPPTYHPALPLSGSPQRLMQQGYTYPPPRGGPRPPNMPPYMSPQYSFYPMPPRPHASMPSGPRPLPPYQQTYHQQYQHQ